MKFIIFFIALFLIVSCGNNFDKAEVSECLNGVETKTEITEEQDEEMSDEDVIYESKDLVNSVELIDKSADAISFYYKGIFACEGFEYGYEIKADKSDETQLLMDISSHDIWQNRDATCICLKKMTVEYSNKDQDLKKITKIEVDHGEGSFEVLEF